MDEKDKMRMYSNLYLKCKHLEGGVGRPGFCLPYGGSLPRSDRPQVSTPTPLLWTEAIELSSTEHKSYAPAVAKGVGVKAVMASTSGSGGHR